MAYIGIKDKTKPIYKPLIFSAFVIFLVGSIIFWILYLSGIEIRNYYYNGIEVEAEIVGVTYEDVDNGDGNSSTRYWVLIYKYVSQEGKEYSGLAQSYSKKEQAQTHIGEKITITIAPNSNKSTISTHEYFDAHKNDIYTDFPLACVFTGLFCISAYLFFYRVVYRSVLDKKILKQYGTGYTDKTTEGEVIKTFGLLWFYVKVKYFDDKSIANEKWARSWFSRSEAKFLEQKQFIKIVPYKNTYGILEEMPNKTHRKYKSK